jgi:glycosyltransferase involved in cell wall biosynthesis
MGCGNAVIAHDNAYNRWTARDAALYFTTPDDIDNALTEVIGSPAVAKKLGLAARRRHGEEFTWEHVAGQYEQLLERFLPMADEARRRAQSRPRRHS